MTDMEQIDPDAVSLPKWYRANPGRAGDLAFIVFTGEGSGTRMHRITNRRWAMSAFGTASSAALSSADTVYSVTPLYHPSGLMMSIGGAIAGHARLAMASSFNHKTFWDEARRYGVTVASYTWTLLRELTLAPVHPGERHHHVRLFIGSGMPRGLWRRVQERFRPARVLEFYATTEAGAILVNVRGTKPGAMGRPLPGSSQVRIAAYDVEQGRLVLGEDGFAVECGPDEVGLLLARVSRSDVTSTAPLRGVFSRDDAWLSSGDLFRRDPDGDYWRVDGLADVILTDAGPVFSGPIRDCLGDLPCVDLAVAYGVPAEDGEHQIAVAAVTLRGEEELTSTDLTQVLAALPPDQRPTLVKVVDAIPVTTWYRPLTGPLREAGIPEPGDGVQGWTIGPSGTYRPLMPADPEALAGQAI
jgi:putative long chain acyl-CoA synthase